MTLVLAMVFLDPRRLTTREHCAVDTLAWSPFSRTARNRLPLHRKLV